MKKILSVTVAMAIIFGALSMFGCYKETEYGDFRCGIRGGGEIIDIFGLSAEGKNKEVIFIPKEIDGYEVGEIGHISTFGVSSANFESEKLKRIYLETDESSGQPAFRGAINLEKIFILNLLEEFIWIEAEEVFLKKTDFDRCKENNKIVLPANVSYFYNYEGAPNEGYYWLDDLENGETITYIPENPTRDGYLFGGWFKDEACTQVWDFETDTITKPADEYYENILYAKWNKKNY